MCWIAKNLKCQQSKEKVPIYKVLRVNRFDRLEAYFRGTVYVLNKEYKESIGYYFDYFINRHIIDEGIHCYSASCKFERKKDGIFAITTDCTYDRYYQEGRISFTNEYYRVVVVKGYIPFDTEYYINDNQEIVTTKIVLTDVLDL